MNGPPDQPSLSLFPSFFLSFFLSLLSCCFSFHSLLEKFFFLLKAFLPLHLISISLSFASRRKGKVRTDHISFQGYSKNAWSDTQRRKKEEETSGKLHSLQVECDRKSFFFVLVIGIIFLYFSSSHLQTPNGEDNKSFWYFASRTEMHKERTVMIPHLFPLFFPTVLVSTAMSVLSSVSCSLICIRTEPILLQFITANGEQ